MEIVFSIYNIILYITSKTLPVYYALHNNSVKRFAFSSLLSFTSQIYTHFHHLPHRLPPVEGALVHALYLDGASWDCQLNSIVPLPPKELLCAMPVIYIKSIVQEKQESQRCYECPLYKTR